MHNISIHISIIYLNLINSDDKKTIKRICICFTKKSNDVSTNPQKERTTNIADRDGLKGAYDDANDPSIIDKTLYLARTILGRLSD